MDPTYRAVAEFAQTWGLAYFVAIFLIVLAYALWPSRQQQFDEERAAILVDKKRFIYDREAQRGLGDASERNKAIDDRAAGIAKPQQFCDFVECFSRGVVEGLADIVIAPGTGWGAIDQVEMRVSARDHQRKRWESQIGTSCSPVFEENGVNVSFEMIHCNQRL